VANRKKNRKMAAEIPPLPLAEGGFLVATLYEKKRKMTIHIK